MSTPTVGQVVWYESPSATEAAIVTHVHDADVGIVNLIVFSPSGGTSVQSHVQRDNNAAGTVEAGKWREAGKGDATGNSKPGFPL